MEVNELRQKRYELENRLATFIYDELLKFHEETGIYLNKIEITTPLIYSRNELQIRCEIKI